MKRNRKTDNAIREFVKMTINNPSLLNNAEKAKSIAHDVLIKNKETNDEIEKDRA